jgi:hypothetical protein
MQLPIRAAESNGIKKPKSRKGSVETIGFNGRFW